MSQSADLDPRSAPTDPEARERWEEQLFEQVRSVLDATDDWPHLYEGTAAFPYLHAMTPHGSEGEQRLMQRAVYDDLTSERRMRLVRAVDALLAKDLEQGVRSAAELTRECLLTGPEDDTATQIVLQLVANLLMRQNAQLIAQIQAEPPDEVRSAAIEVATGGAHVEEAARTLVEAGDVGVITLYEQLGETDLLSVLDEFETLQEEGRAERMIAAVEIYRQIGGPSAVRLLVEWLLVVNHRDLERALVDALLASPEAAADAVMLVLDIEGDRISSGGRFALLELLEKLGQRQELVHRLHHEFVRSQAAQNPMDMEEADRAQLGISGEPDEDAFEDDDLEDLAEMLTRVVQGRELLLLLALGEEDEAPLAEAVRAPLQSALVVAEAEAPEEVKAQLAAARARRAEELPVLLRDRLTQMLWTHKLSQRWSCEPHDPRIGEALADVPVLDLALCSTNEAFPEPGPKELFLGKIQSSELPAMIASARQQIPTEVPDEIVQGLMSQIWMLRQRSESGWKPPLQVMLRERWDRTPEAVREQVLVPQLHDLTVAAVLASDGDDDPDGIHARLRVAKSLLPEDDPVLVYALSHIDQSGRKGGSAIWTPDQGPAPSTPVRRGKKIGRNDPCPCNSGRKYKHCCLGRS